MNFKFSKRQEMEKASKVIRRSGVRLRTLSSRHAELEMLISELRTVRTAQRSLVSAQTRAAQDLVKWSLRDENRAVQETAQLLAELTGIYADVQTEFNAQLKALRYQFEMILEGEEQLDTCRSELASCEAKETKHRRELKKAGAADRQQAELKLTASERAKNAAQTEVTERARENEVAKMARLKQGLLTLSDAYLQLAHKTQLVFQAHRDVVAELPDLDAQQLHSAKYTGSQRSQKCVSRVRELLRPPEPAGGRADSAPAEPPPPYAADPSDRRRSAHAAAAVAADSPGSPPCRCGAQRSYGWRDSSLSSASDFSPSAPVASSPGWAVYPAGGGAGHGAWPPGHTPPPPPPAQVGGGGGGGVHRWHGAGHGQERDAELAGAVGGLQLR